MEAPAVVAEQRRVVGWRVRIDRAAVVLAVHRVATAAGAFGDGVVAGLAVFYVLAVALTAGTQHLGLGVLSVVLPAILAALALGILTAIVAVALVLVRRAAKAVRRVVARHTPAPALRGIAAVPDGVVGRLNVRATAVVAAIVILGFGAPAETPLQLLRPASLVALPAAVLALAAGFVQLARRSAASPARAARVVAATSVGLAVVLAGGGAAWAAWPGDARAMERSTSSATTVDAVIEAPNPAEPGPYAVTTTSYGSGTDQHREAYGASVPIRTRSVAAPPSLRPYPGLMGDAYRAFWGFGFEALPLNALVWHPVGAGPFPLVLIVHGNHTMGEFSEPGYAYLAERLASHGMIVASVDENFLNGGFAGDLEGREMATRAWLLLLHLDLWRAWNADATSPFHRHVDLDRVALVGHSRGGEAASVAASFSTQEIAPVVGMAPWPEGLRVRAVVSIAPSDGQYGSGTVRLRDTSFLTLTGGLDADATAWSGIRQYARVTPPADGFKAAVWAARANHGQFSTVWGTSDHGPLAMWLVNRAAMMDAAAQQQLARVYIGGFLAATLQDRDDYRALFRNPSAGQAWLPDENVLVRSLDGRFVPLLDASRPSPSEVPGVTTAAGGRATLRVMDLPLRAIQDTQQNRVHVLRWEEGPDDATVEVRLDPSVVLGLALDTSLAISLADGRSETAAVPLDPVLVVRTRDGVEVRRALSVWGCLALPMPAPLYKDEPLAEALGIGPGLRSRSERVLQSWLIPFGQLADGAPSFDPSQLSSIRIEVAADQPGTLYLDEIGLVPG